MSSLIDQHADRPMPESRFFHVVPDCSLRKFATHAAAARMISPRYNFTPLPMSLPSAAASISQAPRLRSIRLSFIGHDAFNVEAGDARITVSPVPFRAYFAD